MISTELNLGRAGQFITIADLLIEGIQAYGTDEGVNYDIVADVGGKLLKIQVKATRKPRLLTVKSKPIYFFQIKRSGKSGIKYYTVGDFDIFALVALDIRKVFYLPFNEKVKHNSICLRDKNLKYALNGDKELYYQDLTWQRCLDELLNAGQF